MFARYYCYPAEYAIKRMLIQISYTIDFRIYSRIYSKINGYTQLDISTLNVTAQLYTAR